MKELERPFEVVNWAGAGQELTALGYEPTDEVGSITHKHDETKTIWEVAKDLYDNGLNVMIVHRGSEECDLLAVDYRRFGQI